MRRINLRYVYASTELRKTPARLLFLFVASCSSAPSAKNNTKPCNNENCYTISATKGEGTSITNSSFYANPTQYNTLQYNNNILRIHIYNHNHFPQQEEPKCFHDYIIIYHPTRSFFFFFLPFSFSFSYFPDTQTPPTCMKKRPKKSLCARAVRACRRHQFIITTISTTTSRLNSTAPARGV